jgi:hypothetical protein
MLLRGKINKNKSQNKAKVALIISNLNVLWQKRRSYFLSPERLFIYKLKINVL